MKKSLRLRLSGSVHPHIYNQFIKDHAERLGIKGYMRYLSDGKIEIFIEGDTDSVLRMSPLCKRGPEHADLVSVEEKVEHFQDFKEFKILVI